MALSCRQISSKFSEVGAWGFRRRVNSCRAARCGPHGGKGSSLSCCHEPSLLSCFVFVFLHSHISVQNVVVTIEVKYSIHRVHLFLLCVVGMFRKADIGQEFSKLCTDGQKLTIEHLPALAEALQISPDDIVMYILPWKLNSKTPLEISKEEWVEGMKTMRIESLDRLRQALPNLRNDIRMDHNFKAFYNFVFEWVRDSPNAKYLPNEGACDLWQLLFAGRSFTMIEKWLQFIKTVHGKSVSRDLWRQTLEFAPVTMDLSKYDPDGAWPTAMDEFVEWVKKN